VSCLVPAGEGHLMSWDEHIMLIAHTVNVYGDRLKVRLC
jgi:4-hydroxy-tetrahydrodipicolinate synthase